MKKCISKFIATVILVIIGIAVLTNMKELIERSYSLVERNTAIATVNGGDGEFAAVQLAKSGGQMLMGLVYFGYFFVVTGGIISSYTVYMKWKKSDEEKGKEAQ